ncbi:MAG: DUF2384 domain-containing protein [Cyclobacteriaceae bacterium]
MRKRKEKEDSKLTVKEPAVPYAVMTPTIAGIAPAGSFDFPKSKIDPSTLDYLRKLGFTKVMIAKMLELHISTYNRWESKGEYRFSRLQTKYIVDILQIARDGERVFGSTETFRQWLHSSNAALDNEQPFLLLQDPFDLELVRDALSSLSWGAPF